MEEKRNMTDEQLETALSNHRRSSRRFKILTYIFGVATILLFGTSLIPIAIVCLVLTFIFGYQLSRHSEALKKTLGSNVINEVLEEVFETVEYNPFGKISSISSAGMVFPFRYDKLRGSDYIKATYRGLNVELSDVELINAEELIDADGNVDRSENTVFRGQWLICDFGKELSGEVHISGKSKKSYGVSISGNVKMENERFNRQFFVNAQNPQEAYYILTPHMMDYILTMSEKSGGTVYMSFLRDGKLHIAVQTGRDFFELGGSKVNIESLRNKFLGELHWFTDIIDELRLADTLYKKGGSI